MTKNAVKNENRIMWTKAQRPQMTKNLVQKRESIDKKYKKNYKYEY